jgi:putative transposase
MLAANARKDFLQKLSTDLAKSHSVIKIEKLQIQNMTRSAKGTVDRPGTNVKAKSRLNRSILDQGWGMFATMLNYKLAARGGKLVYVDPAYTSQTCAECHVTDKASRIDQARFVCAHCGHEDSADINGARNIHQARALADEPPKRILRRIGKRKHPEEQHV